ncbi:MAG TPA: hypothetical protein PKI93_00245 [Alphaproteobacteria bacterium]|nr:hypothetical protein [Alphaproteobacteria bacterium]HNS43990.1 hypothetical protein [Alphaproteobacteria bacterium]
MAKSDLPDLGGRFHDNIALKGREDNFVMAEALVAPVLASWRESLFAHEWLHQDGSIRKPAEMSEKMRLRRKTVEELLGTDAALERPVLGIGILDNIEIGAGRDLFLALAAKGIDRIPVHIPKNHIEDFRFFIRQT